MNIKIQRIIFAILTIATFTTIFIFSSQNGDESGSISREFTKKIIEILQLDKNLNEIEKENLIENSQFVIRKLAHFTIYTIAGINIYGFINTYDIKNKNKVIGALIVGVIYAISDEIHQMFSGDRTPAVRDVLIDTCGILFGIFLFFTLNRIVRSIKNKTYSNSLLF